MLALSMPEQTRKTRDMVFAASKFHSNPHARFIDHCTTNYLSFFMIKHLPSSLQTLHVAPDHFSLPYDQSLFNMKGSQKSHMSKLELEDPEMFRAVKFTKLQPGTLLSCRLDGGLVCMIQTTLPTQIASGTNLGCE